MPTRTLPGWSMCHWACDFPFHQCTLYKLEIIMDPTTASFIINGLLALACYFLKSAHADLKEENKNLWVECNSIRKELSNVKDKYFKKEDFNDFKKELWARLDRMEDDFKQQIQELKK
jgi:hypothetical protein